MSLADHLALLACLGSTCFMAGLITFVQFVHYPLFGRVVAQGFVDYHAEHCRLTSRVVAAPMLLGLVTSVFLAARPPWGSSPWLAWSGLAAEVVAWGVTGLSSVPCHNRLALGFDGDSHAALMRSNLARLAAWNTHAVIVLVMTARALR